MGIAIQKLKKVELHRHFEGCITPSIFHNLVQKNHPNSPYINLNKVTKLYEFSDFTGFFETFKVVVYHITEYNDFKVLADGIAQDLIRENIIFRKKH